MLESYKPEVVDWARVPYPVMDNCEVVPPSPFSEPPWRINSQRPPFEFF